ncbi:MAG: Fic family protein [Acidobacteriota bacterium]|nr:MAG: Fic family protein [Acidobacteriota bacterium]
MERDLQGEYVTVSTVGEVAEAFVPSPLPPNPPIVWSPDLSARFDRAHLSLGKLESAAKLLPAADMLLYSYVRKEAVLSSMIEGTQSSLSDLLKYESEIHPGVPLDDVREVSNYVAALNHGLRRLAEGFPISLRLIRETHKVLLSEGRGKQKRPGELRKSQNWIGGTRPGNASFVPPPAEQVPECMGNLELFLNDRPGPSPPLLKAALSHVQFETIHPFLDGNGRVGRLLITLILCNEGLLSKPLLYLSLYFKEHREFYYELLNRVRTKGDWESWLSFFAEAVEAVADETADSLQRLSQIVENDRVLIGSLGRAADSASKVHSALVQRPIMTADRISKHTGITAATVNKSLRHLEELGIISEMTGRKRNRLFSYPGVLEVLNRGTEW